MNTVTFYIIAKKGINIEPAQAHTKLWDFYNMKHKNIRYVMMLTYCETNTANI